MPTFAEVAADMRREDEEDRRKKDELFAQLQARSQALCDDFNKYASENDTPATAFAEKACVEFEARDGRGLKVWPRDGGTFDAEKKQKVFDVNSSDYAGRKSSSLTDIEIMKLVLNWCRGK